MGILNIAHTVLGAGAQLFDKMTGQNRQKGSQVESNTATIQGLVLRVEEIEEHLEVVGDALNLQGEMLIGLARANRTLARWVIGLMAVSVTLGAIAVTALVLAL